VRTEGRDGELLVVVGGVPLERVGVTEQTEGATREKNHVSDGFQGVSFEGVGAYM
jgi:hypothetical protein